MTSEQPVLLVHCSLKHHGAAAAVSGNQIVAWLLLQPRNHTAASTTGAEEVNSSNSGGSSTLVYASHAVINLAVPTIVKLLGNNGLQQQVRHVATTLRCSALERQQQLQPPVITCLVAVKDGSAAAAAATALVSGFSNGMIQMWIPRSAAIAGDWTEHTILPSTIGTGNNGGGDGGGSQQQAQNRSITTLDAVWISETDVWIAAGTSAGAVLYHCCIVSRLDGEEFTVTALTVGSVQNLLVGAVSTVYFAQNWQATNGISKEKSAPLLLVGTAAPRHNKIHVFAGTRHAGFLTGHEDWITSLAHSPASSLLASGSQDTRIRLWKFRTSTVGVARDTSSEQQPEVVDAESLVDDDDDLMDEEEDEVGESRLEILNENKTSTSVTLEALLYGHEESVTAVTWHPDPATIYGVDSLLISSSMDRTVLLWSESCADGIWTPLSRVGSAGGILGGSIGSTLLGFCGVSIEPVLGRSLVGHAYGGTLHLWDLEVPATTDETAGLTVEERAALVKWKASPCLTGHFDGVTDLCWEAAHGDYLLTVSNDQTCRLWAPVAKASEDSRDEVWLELARPQVHGYDLSAVASLSTRQHPHLLVTGADEKELRAFDAPKTTLRILKATSGVDAASDEAAGERVERAFIPSLGLSNKASAADAAEEDAVEGATRGLEATTLEKMRLPLERDLGAVSLWPEIQKLYGHNTEIYCLASTLAARTAGEQAGGYDDILVASSAKARDAEDAKLRLWNVKEGKCVHVLSGGHKSTVATLSFSPDGRFLASSGKDRRLCVWKRDRGPQPSFALAWAKDTAHKRIVWSVDFCPFDSNILASGSRDGCVKIWRLDDNQQSLQLTELSSFAPLFQKSEKPDAVTALSFAPISFETGSAVLALGLESGRIELWTVPLAKDAGVPHPLPNDLKPSLCHSATITKLAWRPVKDTEAPTLHLASCSMDHGCRIFEIDVPR